MKKIFLLLTLLTYCGFAQTTTTINQLNTKTNLDSADYFIIAQSTDSANYKVPFDAIVDKVEDSLAKPQIAYKNAYNTFLYPQTFNGFTSGGASTFNSSATFNGTNVVNGSITFNSRPTFYGALFDAAGYGLIRFNDSTYFYNGQTTFYNNPVVFDGNSNITLYGTLNTIGGAKLKLPPAIYSADFSTIGYTGSDGSGVIVFDYGSGTSNRDTIPSRRFLRSNYPGLSTNNTFLGNNTFSTGLTSINSASVGQIAIVDGIYISYDSLSRSANFTLDVSGGENTYLIRNTSGSNIIITNVTGGQHGQLIMIMIHPTTVSTITLADGGSVKLVGDVNFTMGSYDSVTLRNYWGTWIEVARANH